MQLRLPKVHDKGSKGCSVSVLVIYLDAVVQREIALNVEKTNVGMCNKKKAGSLKLLH